MSNSVLKVAGGYFLILAPLLFSPDCWSQSFTAKVTLTLVNPITLVEENAIDFGLINLIDGGQCDMSPDSGVLTGNACVAAAADKSVINISGTKGLAVSVNLSNSSADSGIQFVPRLYNGANDHSSFVLDDYTHSINIGGSLLISNAATAGAKSLDYGVEVIYQ